MGVDTQHPDYVSMAGPWTKMQDVTASEDTIKLKGETYLPKLTDMTDAQYDGYKNRASFVTFTKRAIEAFVGMVMRKDVQIDEYDDTNIDGKGGDINSYTDEILRHYLTYSRCGTLVDMPQTDKILSIADAESKNVKPRLLFYESDSIINWKTKVVDNIVVLSMVVLRESVEADTDDEFSHQTEYRYRVLDLNDNNEYRQRIFNNDLVQEGNDIYPRRKGQRMTFIPFIVHGGPRVQFPLLYGVANENIHHYQLDADYKHGLHFVALPTPYITGADPEDPNIPTSVGPGTLWVLPNEQSRCGMLEFTGAGMHQIKTAKDESVETIIILTSRILAPEKSSNDESALAAAIRNNAETSTLAGVAKTLSKEFTELLKISSWWQGKNTEKVKVIVNSDFMPITLSGADMLSYVTAWIKGGISYESLFHVLKTGEIIQGDRDLDDEFKDITAESKARLALEVEKAGKLAGAEGKKEDEDDGLARVREPDAEIKQDLQLK